MLRNNIAVHFNSRLIIGWSKLVNTAVSHDQTTGLSLADADMMQYNWITRMRYMLYSWNATKHWLIIHTIIASADNHTSSQTVLSVDNGLRLAYILSEYYSSVSTGTTGHLRSVS